MKPPHDLDGLDVDWVLFFKLVLLIPGDKREGVNVFVQLRERQLHSMYTQALEEW